jgi:hypothetical protein
MLQLRSERFYCSQVLVTMALDLLGRDDPTLVRAMEGLAGGLGFTGDTCGTLSAGAVALGLWAGRGRAEEDEDPTLIFMIEDLVRWFNEGYGNEYGGIRCREILAGDPNAQATRCPVMVAGTFQKVKELLVDNGFDLSVGHDDAG